MGDLGLRGNKKKHEHLDKEGTVKKRTWLIGIMVIFLMALVGKDASARVCVAKIGSTCVLWSGSVECNVTGAGGHPGWTAECTVAGESSWLVACVNNGGNYPPGINLVEVDGVLSGTVGIDEVERNGRYSVTAFAEPSVQFLLDLVTTYDACPNTNYEAVDAVPCTMTVTISEYDENHCLESDAEYFCMLPDCETLEFDPITLTFERRQYECSRTDTNNYSCP